jgi:AAA15 family ATPase/GTPase
MSKDFKNVFITFVLIALVFTTGSFVYKKDAQNNQALVDYNKVLSEIKNAEQIKTQQNILIAQLKKEQDQLDQSINQNQALTQNSQTTTIRRTSNNATATSNSQAILLSQQAALLAAQQSQAKLLAQQKANQKATILAAQQQAAAVAAAGAAAATQQMAQMSRQSRAS